MTRKNVCLRRWIENFDAGKYDAPDRTTQIDAGWYDWFCNDSSLAGKTKRLAPKVKRIAKSQKFDLNKVYVFFKNNCPCVGNLYDDFRICDLATGDVLYTIIPNSGHTSKHGQSEVWGTENDFNGPLIEGTWKDVLAFFDGDPELICPSLNRLEIAAEEIARQLKLEKKDIEKMKSVLAKYGINVGSLFDRV